MTNDERDNMLIEIHGDIKVIAGKVDEHHQTLYGNGNAGLKQDLALLALRQKDCPARIATTAKGKRLNLAYVAVAIAVISCVTSVVSVVALVSRLAGP